MIVEISLVPLNITSMHCSYNAPLATISTGSAHNIEAEATGAEHHATGSYRRNDADVCGAETMRLGRDRSAVIKSSWRKPGSARMNILPRFTP